MKHSIPANDISNTVLFDIGECCVWLIARLEADVGINADISCAALTATNFALAIFRQGCGAIMWRGSSAGHLFEKLCAKFLLVH